MQENGEHRPNERPASPGRLNLDHPGACWALVRIRPGRVQHPGWPLPYRTHTDRTLIGGSDQQPDVREQARRQIPGQEDGLGHHTANWHRFDSFLLRLAGGMELVVMPVVEQDHAGFTDVDH